MNQALLALLALALSGCGLITASPGDPAGPEQFLFPAVAGEGKGARAEQLLEGMARGREADHLATVRSPLGDLHFLKYVGADGNSCRAIIGPRFGSTACSFGEAAGFPAAGEIVVSAAGVDDWVIVEVTAGPGVAAATATAADGTTYRAQVVGGVGAVVYPARRGDLTIQALDAGDAPIGDTVVAEFVP